MSRLLSRAEMDLAELVDKGCNRPALECVHVTEKHSEVTNGHYLVRIPACPMDPKEFPAVPGIGNGAGDILIQGQALAGAAKAVPKKSSIPILNALHIGKSEDGSVVTASTDLESPCVRTSKPPETTFPDCDNVIPNAKEGAMQFALSSTYLKRLAAFVEKHGRGKAPAIRFMVNDDSTAVRMEFETEDGQALIVLMPIRY